MGLHTLPLDRFWSKVIIDDEPNGCWLWRGPFQEVGGYGVFAIGRQTRVYAHRFMFEITRHQVIPRGKFVCHTCDNPACVNPSHMFLGGARENAIDMFAKGRGNPSGWRTKTHCKHGHEYTETNTYRTAKQPTRRQCRACKVEWERGNRMWLSLNAYGVTEDEVGG